MAEKSALSSVWKGSPPPFKSHSHGSPTSIKWMVPKHTSNMLLLYIIIIQDCSYFRNELVNVDDMILMTLHNHHMTSQMATYNITRGQ